jgi:glycosyltransferase involved in cell wall biosynthesis
MMHPARKILFVCHDAALYGSQRSLELILKYLPSEQYQCFVSVARSGPLEERLAQLPNVTVLHHKRLQWVKHDKRNAVQKIGDVFTLLFNAFSRAKAIQKLVKQHDIHLVHTNSTVSLEGALGSAMAGVPHVWHIRELFMEPSPKFHLMLGCKLSRLMMASLAHRVICISKAVQSQFGPYLEVSPQQFPLIYNALEPETVSLEPQPKSHNSVFKIGYLGRISEGKGLHELLEALSYLEGENLSIELHVVGSFVDNAYERRISQQILQLNLSEKVRFWGYQDDAASFLKQLDVLAVPSANEPFGRVIIEAMANRIPCIAANSGGAPELIEQGETGLLYPPGQAKVLALGLKTLYESPELSEKIKEKAGRMVLERFTINSQIRMLEECYQSLLPRLT